MAKRFGMIYGPSGSGKSRWLAILAADIFKKTGKKAYVNIGDGGVSTYEDMGLIDAGIVQVFDYRTRDWPLSITQQISEGYRPEDPDDPKSKMIPPTPEFLDSIGLWIFEGTTVMSEYILGHKKGGLAERAGRGEKIGENSPIRIQDVERNTKGEIIDGTGITIGGNPPSHYNVVQRHMLSVLERSKALPGIVVWTGHEKLAEDKMQGGKQIIGPDVGGKALTANINKQFSFALHSATAMGQKKEKDPVTNKEILVPTTEYRIYTRDHFEPNGDHYIKYVANGRCPSVKDSKGRELMPLYLAGEDADPRVFFRILEEAKARSAEMLGIELQDGDAA
jgi:energy-coupling factor transporter ATP-binding protein EcfA2